MCSQYPLGFFVFSRPNSPGKTEQHANNHTRTRSHAGPKKKLEREREKKKTQRSKNLQNINTKLLEVFDPCGSTEDARLLLVNNVRDPEERKRWEETNNAHQLWLQQRIPLRSAAAWCIRFVGCFGSTSLLRAHRPVREILPSSSNSPVPYDKREDAAAERCYHFCIVRMRTRCATVFLFCSRIHHTRKTRSNWYSFHHFSPAYFDCCHFFL